MLHWVSQQFDGQNIQAICYHPGLNDEFEQHLRKCIPDAFEDVKDGFISCSTIPSLKYVCRMSLLRDDDMMSVNSLMTTAIGASVTDSLEEQSNVGPDDILTVFLTSGSTGSSKAIPVTHFRHLNKFRSTRYYSDYASEGDRIFNDRSLTWIGGDLHWPICNGVTIVYVPPLAKSSDRTMDFGFQVDYNLLLFICKISHFYNKYLISYSFISFSMYYA